ncbi:phospholipase B1, membrane-associated-like isoform X1 [Toxorhynchites rutilus septentrionalis]|uniref:phospholipase B1, membrane-associated-like isoform X1 n=2 Tax=Toxorhynchites rutilus septentrionalis TaxID=329112 RepID=UPI002478DC1F|nr:phospholipase B1, membrane-associated-like isoform X1 [Toxorhynchites rutilus septentrionalis]
MLQMEFHGRKQLILSLLVLAIAQMETGLGQNRINRQRGNILKNLTKTHEYENHIVTSQLDASTPIRMFYRGFREIYNRLLGPTGGRVEGSFLQPHVMPNVPFPCDTRGYRSDKVPTSVHQLRPGDIDIISAVGDSLTSATAANSVALWELLIENRGLAWCIGGQGTWRTHLTLPNILKEFNPKLFGYSLFDSYNVHPMAQFNVAENIATTTDMPYNAAKLVERMKLDPRVEWEQHWKLLTFMIGGNDFCSDVCYQTNATEWINEVQEKYLIKTLLYLRNNMPRTIVNLVPSPLISLSFSMDKAQQLPLSCYFSRPIECSCLFGPKYSNRRDLFRKLERNFVKIMERVSYLPDFHSDDFTVVYQPFFKDASVFYRRDGKPDMAIMSIDCVHLSQKGHAVSANGLWNNMLEPTGAKSLGLRQLYEQFKCPTPQSPYIKTYFNS